MDSQLLMILVNVPLQSSRGIFINTAKSHKCTQSSKVTIQQQSYNVIEILKRKKFNNMQLGLQKLSSESKGIEALDDFYTDHPFVD